MLTPKRRLKKLPERLQTLQDQYPEAEIELWSFDEHRLGLKPILRKVWSLIGKRPEAVVNHRYEWMYVYGYVHPQSGQTEWHLLPRVNTDWFEASLAEFARAVGVGPHKRAVLLLDGAGWHRTQRLQVPEGIHLEFLPPYSPELQPAERLWPLVDEPLVNRDFPSLDALEQVLAERCQYLSAHMSDFIQALTDFHWWPKQTPPFSGG